MAGGLRGGKMANPTKVSLLVPILEALADADGVAMSARQIGDVLGVSRQTVSTVVARHMDLGVIRGVDEYGKCFRYYVKEHVYELSNMR